MYVVGTCEFVCQEWMRGRILEKAIYVDSDYCKLMLFWMSCMSFFAISSINSFAIFPFLFGKTHTHSHTHTSTQRQISLFWCRFFHMSYFLGLFDHFLYEILSLTIIWWRKIVRTHTHLPTHTHTLVHSHRYACIHLPWSTLIIDFAWQFTKWIQNRWFSKVIC